MRRWLRARIERLFHSRIAECTALRVTAVRQVTPHMRRVTFAGRNLQSFATEADLHVKLLLPPEGAARDGWLVEGADGKVRLRGKALDPVFRKYTIRTIDARAERVEVDFVMHADGGPGAAWARGARPGDVVGMIGPGGRGLARADWYLIAGDETALPAIGRMTASLPAEARGHVIVEIAGRAEEQPLVLPAAMELTWLHRGAAAPGTTSLLLEAVKAVRWPAGDVPVFAWIAAEFAATQVIRRHLRDARKLGREEQLVVAYWRRDQTPAGG